MLKRFAWLAKLVAAGLILSFLSIWTTGYIVTSYVDSILKQFNLPLEVPPMTMTGMWGKLWGSDPLLESDVAGTDKTDEASEEAEDPPLAVDAFGQEQDAPITGMGVGGGTEANGGAETPGGSTEEGAAGSEANGDGTEASSGAGGEAAGNEGGNSSASGGSTDENVSGADNGDSEEGISQEDPEADGLAGGEGTDGTETAMTPEELTDVKQQMSSEDKEKLFALLMSKLPQNTWQTISQYVENGLTEQELTDIQQIMAQHLDKEEYEQMMSILKKY